MKTQTFREFLNLEGFHSTASVYSLVEDGYYNFEITDCQRKVILTNNFYNVENLKNALHKMETLKKACEFTLKALQEVNLFNLEPSRKKYFPTKEKALDYLHKNNWNETKNISNLQVIATFDRNKTDTAFLLFNKKNKKNKYILKIYENINEVLN